MVDFYKLDNAEETPTVLALAEPTAAEAVGTPLAGAHVLAVHGDVEEDEGHWQVYTTSVWIRASLLSFIYHLLEGS